MEDSDYKAKLVKTVKNEKGKRLFYFEVFNLLSIDQSQDNKFSQLFKTNSTAKNCI